jgi:SprT-like family
MVSAKGEDSMKHRPHPITPVEYEALQTAYDHFNNTLFGGRLPNESVFITLQRQARSLGYFSPERFSGRIDNRNVHELALNPDGFRGSTDEAITQTLVHEMVHAWQHLFGNAGSGRYHNREWAGKMKEIGLYPSSTGEPGGKETGAHMSDYVIPGGAFQVAYQALQQTGWRLRWQSGSGVLNKGEAGKSSKTKFSCPECDQNVWGKPDTNVICGICEEPMTAEIQISAAEEAAIKQILAE